MKKVLLAILFLIVLSVFGCTTGEQLTTDTSAEGNADVQTSADAAAATATANEDAGLREEEQERMPSMRKAFKVGLLSPRGCEGSGSFMLGASPLALGDIEKIRPMGGLSSVHITPTDHQYWDTIGSDGRSEDTTNLDRFKVFAPADGFIVDIEQHTDYRVVIEHSCTFYTIFIHVDKLSDKIMAAAGLKEGEVGKHAWPRIPVKEGEVIGTIGIGKLDFSVVDADSTLKGFVNPESYEGEIWKIHTVDTFDYYEEPLRSKLIAKNVRTILPLGGKIDYDVEGRLVGNWFREGTGKYKGNLGEYWKNHLSIVYDSIDPSQIRVSIGDFGGWSQVFGATGNSPDPATVDGLVKYELTTFDYYLGDTSTKFNPAKYSNNIRGRNLDEVRGVALFKVLSENRLQAEFFPDKKAAEVAGFTISAVIYER
ncbi:hypothetical protein HYV85_00480 [Candidatus Woesearchaeota archaeon]|nr:hypothetical protein [Candidatus Woesearchaeota archaeon]